MKCNSFHMHLDLAYAKGKKWWGKNICIFVGYQFYMKYCIAFPVARVFGHFETCIRAVDGTTVQKLQVFYSVLQKRFQIDF